MGFYEVILSKVQNVALTVTVGGFVTVGVFGISRHTRVKTCVCCEIHEDKEVSIRLEVGGRPLSCIPDVAVRGATGCRRSG